ncbi:LysR substrate-binding domain-containing protein [Paralcaligenes ureilyticus]|uniref:LysR family cys regulon transcriptional activator n=1 Tax=Paralcaligenes ureilyticus TaxID=627131 RepID=A0A4R3LT15_9BURK|nr:LysR substrate-binding domain-containing protein [Paralcaligenes ureilyticus]TCT03724.1 LysR family cys regulon transcriptional activator [Paralcaligenes ureilyticus]
MKFRQLECLCEVVSSGYNLSHAAHNLCASQPTVTRQLQLLEEDLGFEILARRGNRIGGLTQQGHAVYERAQKIVHESRQLQRLSDELHNNGSGKLVIATTHFHARYTLLDAIKKLRASHPKISFSILSGNMDAIERAVTSGHADIGICVGRDDIHPALVSLPCFEIHRIIIVPPGHPLLRVRKPSLERLAQYPIITYDQDVSAGWRIAEAFSAHKLSPEIVLSAAGAEVIKAYTAAGLGIAVIQELAFDKRKDSGIRAISADHLFEPVTVVAMIRRRTFLTSYMRDLLKVIACVENDSEIEAAFHDTRA